MHTSRCGQFGASGSMLRLQAEILETGTRTASWRSRHSRAAICQRLMQVGPVSDRGTYLGCVRVQRDARSCIAPGPELLGRLKMHIHFVECGEFDLGICWAGRSNYHQLPLQKNGPSSKGAWPRSSCRKSKIGFQFNRLSLAGSIGASMTSTTCGDSRRSTKAGGSRAMKSRPRLAADPTFLQVFCSI
jgi:hypothetical protein